MSTRHTAAVARVALILLVTGLMATPAFAQDDAFKDGLKAISDKKWPEAAAAMRKAIQSDGKESLRRVRAGGLFGLGGTEEPYLPYFFLGQALMAVNDCAGAIDAWAQSERQGVVQGDRLALIRKNYDVCAGRGVLPPAAYDAAHARASQKYADAAALFTRVSGLAETHKDVLRTPVADPLERARANLEASHAKLMEGTRTRREADFTESGAAADRSAAALRTVEGTVNAAIDTVTTVQQLAREAERLLLAAGETNRAIDAAGAPLTSAMTSSRTAALATLGGVREQIAAGQRARNPAGLRETLQHVQQASSALDEVLAGVTAVARRALDLQVRDATRDADQALSLVTAALATLERRATSRGDALSPEFVTTRDTVLQQVAAIRRRYDRARKASDVAALRDTSRAAADANAAVESLIGSFGPVTLRERGVPAALEAGTRLFLAGEHETAIRVLDEPLELEPHLQVHVHLIRAAARHALYLRNGAQDERLLADALEEIARGKALNPGFQPDPRVFNPRFVTLFRSDPASANALPQP